MAGFHFGLLGQFETILPGETPLPIETYLQGVDKDTLLKIGTALIGYDPNTSEFRDWRNLLNMWFSERNFEFKEKVWHQCELLSQLENEQVSFLYPTAGLKFFETVFSLPESQLKLHPADSEIPLFKAYLLILSIVTKNETAGTAGLDKYIGFDLPSLTLLKQQFPATDFMNYQLSDIFNCQIIKACILFTFLESKHELQPLLQGFYKHFGISNWREYLKHFLTMISAYTKNPDSSWTQLVIEKNERYDKSCHFLEALSLQTFETELNTDFKFLRGRPVYKVGEGKYGIIHYLFIFEKMYKGLYFHLKEIFDQLPASNITNWKQYYTKNFSESVLLYSIMEYIYQGSPYVRFTGDKIDELLNQGGGPDYYIRDGNDLFLFENKDVLVNADIKHSGDFEKMEVAFRSKFYYEKDGSKTKAKAILQLIRNIERALKNANVFDTGYKGKKLSIFPLLIVHDASFNVIGLNHLLNIWFKKELTKLNEKGINTTNVRPLTVINIDTLILYADYLKSDLSSFARIIDAFVQASVFNKRGPYRNPEEMKNALGTSLLSFSYFIDQYTNSGFTKIKNHYRDSVTAIIFDGDEIPEN